MSIRAIPNQQTNDRNLGSAQQYLSQALSPLLRNPLTNGSILSSVSLTTGDNTIPHGLGRALQGWSIVRMRANFSQIYDKQDTNSSPQNNLILNASADVVADIYVF